MVCCNASGLITVNGVPLHEQSYLYPGDRPSSAPAGIPGRFNVTVPAGYLWVLGDHRGISDDSRGHEADPGNGMIPEDEVIGRAFVIAWPPSQWRILSIPATFEQPGITKTAVAVAAGSAARPAAQEPLPAVAVRPAAPLRAGGGGIHGHVPGLVVVQAGQSAPRAHPRARPPMTRSVPFAVQAGSRLEPGRGRRR